MNSSPPKSKRPTRLLDRLRRSSCMNQQVPSPASVQEDLDIRQMQQQVNERTSNKPHGNDPLLVNFHEPYYSSTQHEGQRHDDAMVSPTDIIPNEQRRRRSIREVICRKVSRFGRRLSQQLSSSSRKSSRKSSHSQDIEEKEAKAERAESLPIPPPRPDSSLPPPPQRVNSAPPVVQHPPEPEPSAMPPLRPVFLGSAMLTATPEVEPEFDPAEAELSFKIQCEAVEAALNEINEHEMKCGPMQGLCDHKYRSRPSSPRYQYPRERKLSERVFTYMEQAIAASRDSDEE